MCVGGIGDDVWGEENETMCTSSLQKRLYIIILYGDNPPAPRKENLIPLALLEWGKI